MTLAFGTDGVRGDTRGPLTGHLIEAVGEAAGAVLGADRFAVGRDTRVSGPGLVDALCRGVRRAGGSAVDLGILPTPAVARWCHDEHVAGAVVSASHNPWHDNGVKLFAPGGRKLSDEAQHDVEQHLSDLFGGWPGATAAGVGEDSDTAEPRSAPPGDSGDALHGTGLFAPGSAEDAAAGGLARRRHVRAVTASLEGRDLTGLRVVVDPANGAAYRCAPDCLVGLGARVETIHAAPNGYNINDACGSLHPESLRDAVVSSGADAGVAFDGDADRVLAVDGSGNTRRRRPDPRGLCPRPGRAGAAHRGRGGGHRHGKPGPASSHGRARHRRGRDPGG